jgi:hypothetical protein
MQQLTLIIFLVKVSLIQNVFCKAFIACDSPCLSPNVSGCIQRLYELGRGKAVFESFKYLLIVKTNE